MIRNASWQVVQPFFIVQSAVLLTLMLLGLAFFGMQVGWSIVCGGLVNMIPNLVFANMLFKHQGARSAKKIASGFYRGEALKFISTMGLFAFVFIFCNVEPKWFFGAYIAAQITIWVLIVFNYQQARK